MNFLCSGKLAIWIITIQVFLGSSLSAVEIIEKKDLGIQWRDKASLVINEPTLENDYKRRDAVSFNVYSRAKQTASFEAVHKIQITYLDDDGKVKNTAYEMRKTYSLTRYSDWEFVLWFGYLMDTNTVVKQITQRRDLKKDKWFSTVRARLNASIESVFQ